MTGPAPDHPVVALCRELVRIPSPSGEEGPLAAFVAERMAAAGLRVEVDRFGSVLGMKTGRLPGPTLLLDAHLDTVAAADPAAWSHDPFGGEVEAGRLFGLGAADTKGSLAAMIGAAEALDDFAGTLFVSASVGEEDLTTAALSHVLDRHPADLVVVGEPTSLRLGVAQKGRAGLVVEARGRSAHSSRPERGVNAVYRMMEAVSRIRAVPLPSDPELGSGVCELIEIHSEPAPSTGMVPHRCTARFALRLLPGETAALVVGRAARALDGLDGVTVRLAETSRRGYTGVDVAMVEFIAGWRNRDASLEKRLLEALGTRPFAAPYTTNASVAAARGIPAFLLGPGSIDQAHAVDEWVAVDELVAARDSYLAAARAFLADHAVPVASVIDARRRDIGGFAVRRLLPCRERRLVGPFVYFDEMGPVRFKAGRGLDVLPHPHIGLATVTYLHDGELLHRDSLGSSQVIRPGDVNWMTAGRGIVHSERTPPERRATGTSLHGLQLWVALPRTHEETEPTFRHHPGGTLPELEKGGVRLRVLAGSAYGATSPVDVLSPLFYVDVAMPAGGELPLPSEHEERALYVLDGVVGWGAGRSGPGRMVVFAPGAEVVLRAESPTRAVLLGGAPLEGPRHISWNFVSSSRERIENARRDWKEGRFPKVPGDETEFVPLPG